MSDASYAIDIVASMTEGEKTVAQLDAVSSALLTAGVDADAMADAVAIASNALTEAGAAGKAANAALADGASVYAELERAANQAAKSQEKAARLGVVPPDVAASVASTTSALEAHVTTLRQLEASAAAATTREAALAVTLKNTKQAAAAGTAALADRERAVKQAADTVKKAAAAEEKAIGDAERAEVRHERQLKKTAGAMRGLGGPLGSVGAMAINAADDFGDMSQTMGKANTIALMAASAFAAVVLAVGAVAVGMAAATVAVGGWAVGLADSRRSAALTQSAVEALDPSIAALSGSFKAITAETGVAAPALSKIAKSLEDAKVSAEDMPAALRAAALAEAALGQGGSSEFLSELKKSKRAAADLSKEFTGKLGPIVSKQMAGISAQSERAKKNIGALFGGLEIDSVLSGMARLVGLFDQTTEAGGAIKFIFESVFQPLINQVDKASVAIEAFALGVLIGLTKLYISAKPAVQALADFFGFDDPATADTMAMVTRAGELLVPVVLGIVAAFTAVVAVAAVVAASLALPLIAVGALVAGVIAGGVALYDAIAGNWSRITSFLGSISLADVGVNMMKGLAGGITSAAGLPLEAITGAANAAIGAAKRALGIKSPSTVFAEIGGYTAEGFAEGVDEGSGQAEASMAAMVAPPAAAPSSAGGGGSAPGASHSVTITGNSFTFQGVEGGEGAIKMFEEWLTRYTEGLADSISGPEAVTA